MNALSEGGRYESSLDEWMLKITCAAFGVPPSEIGFTADVNKATSEGQAQITYRRGLGPLTVWLKQMLFDPIVQSPQYLNQPQLEWFWDFGETESREKEAQSQQADVAAGVITANESRRLRYPDLDGSAPTPAIGSTPAIDGGAPAEKLGGMTVMPILLPATQDGDDATKTALSDLRLAIDALTKRDARRATVKAIERDADGRMVKVIEREVTDGE
jgi:hypothetical protein